jgi:hypothetical protein
MPGHGLFAVASNRRLAVLCGAERQWQRIFGRCQIGIGASLDDFIVKTEQKDVT